MNEQELMKRVEILKREGLWEEIIKLLDGEDSFDETKSVEQLSELGYAYSQAATNLMKLNVYEALRYFLLQEKLFCFLMNDARVDEKKRMQCEKTLAYVYYSLYSDNAIWSNRFRENFYTQEISSLARQNQFQKNALGNKALLLYWHLSPSCKEDVRTIYRTAKLLNKMQQNISFGKGAPAERWEKYKFDYGTDKLRQVLQIKENYYRYFLNKLNQNFFGKIYIEKLEEAIAVYNIVEKNLQDRWQNDYIKALYNSCVYYIKKVEKFYVEKRSDLDTLAKWDLVISEQHLPKWVQNAFCNKELVRNRLWEIMKLEGFSCDNVEADASALARLDVALQPNFLFYRIADYIRVYKIARNENLEQNVRRCVQFYYYSALVDFQMVTDDAHDKSHFKEPYEKFGELYAFLGMRTELKQFRDRFKLRDINFPYYEHIGDFCLKVHEGDFVKALKALQSFKAMKLNKQEQKLLQDMEERFNHYKNNPELVQKRREEKNIAILLRTSLKSICCSAMPSAL